MDPDPASGPQGGNMDSAPFPETAPTAEDIIPEEVTSIESVLTSAPDDSRRTDASATLVDESQDTKPVEPVCAVHVRDQTGDSADNTFTPGHCVPRLLLALRLMK